MVDTLSVVFTLPSLLQPTGCTVAFLLLLLCLPAAANFYIVVSQDVVTVAVVLEMHACVGRDQHLSLMLLAIPTEASARMCSDYVQAGLLVA